MTVWQYIIQFLIAYHEFWKILSQYVTYQFIALGILNGICLGSMYRKWLEADNYRFLDNLIGPLVINPLLTHLSHIAYRLLLLKISEICRLDRSMFQFGMAQALIASLHHPIGSKFQKLFRYSVNRYCNILKTVLYWFLTLIFSIAAACYTLHYAKRLLETIFVHRFSHSTMPIQNLFKNCSYYWGFTAYVAYHVNHPLFTSPCSVQVYAGLAAFIVSFDSTPLFLPFYVMI